MPEALIGAGGGAEAGVLSHRPQPAAIHRWLDSPREGKLARPAQIPVGIPVPEIGRNARRINHIRQYWGFYRSLTRCNHGPTMKLSYIRSSRDRILKK